MNFSSSAFSSPSSHSFKITSLFKCISLQWCILNCDDFVIFGIKSGCFNIKIMIQGNNTSVLMRNMHVNK